MYKWNDFAGTDLKGKIAVMIFGEPTIPGDTVRFNGVRASRFSWFSDKLADLERRGAVGMLLIGLNGAFTQGPVRFGRYLAADVDDNGLRFLGGITDTALARLLPPKSGSLAAMLKAAEKPWLPCRPFRSEARGQVPHPDQYGDVAQRHRHRLGQGGGPCAGACGAQCALGCVRYRQAGRGRLDLQRHTG